LAGRVEYLHGLKVIFCFLFLGEDSSPETRQNTGLSVFIFVGVAGACDSLFTLVLTRPTKTMAALKHDIAVTMATASLPHHESDMAISNALPAQGRRPTLCNLADGGGTFWRSQIALASR